MGDTTARLALPLLHAGQAQKELDHNEALALLDLAVQPVVEAIGLDVPPGSPAEGACWVVGDAPVGAWSGRAGAIAGWTAGGWRFVAPRAGLSAWCAGDGLVARHTGTEWSIGTARIARLFVGSDQVIGARGPAIANPLGGDSIDTEARGALVAVLAALRAHGLIAS